MITKPPSLFALDHKLKISGQSKNQHTLKNFSILVFFLFSFFFYLLIIIIIILVGWGGLEKMKRALEESKKSYMFRCLEGGTVLIMRAHLVKNPNLVNIIRVARWGAWS